jgi:xylulokinase
LSERLLLGVDVGSARLKAVLVDSAGTVVSLAAIATPFAVNGRGVEMRVEDLEVALAQAIGALPAAGRGALAAIGVAGLAESGAPLAANRPCAPVIAWHDGRGEDVAARLEAALGDELALRVGQRPRSVSSVAKLGWLMGNGVDRVDRWLGVPELCVWFLTGAQVTDHSLAARTAAYDIGRREWIPEVLAVAGIPTGVFLDPSPAGSALGRVRAEAGRRFGVPVGLPVTLAGHDHLAAAESMHAAGAAYNSVGTAECVLAFTAELTAVRRALDLRLTVTLRPGGAGYAVFAGAARSGLVLSELATRLARPHAELDALSPADAGAGAAWHTELTRLAESTADAAARLADLLGPAERVVAFGGGSRSVPWMRAKAALLAPTALFRAGVGEAAARGAALAAGVAAGWWPAPGSGPATPCERVT